MSMEGLSAYKQASRPCKKCGLVFSGARCLACWRAYSRSRRSNAEYLAAEKAAADRYYQRNKEQLIAAQPQRRMGAVAGAFYTFSGSVVVAYVGFATWDDKTQKGAP